jgi:hypothetical protein
MLVFKCTKGKYFFKNGRKRKVKRTCNLSFFKNVLQFHSYGRVELLISVQFNQNKPFPINVQIFRLMF